MKDLAGVERTGLASIVRTQSWFFRHRRFLVYTCVKVRGRAVVGAAAGPLRTTPASARMSVSWAQPLGSSSCTVSGDMRFSCTVRWPRDETKSCSCAPKPDQGAETSSSGPLVAIGPTTVCISGRIEEFPSNANSAAFAVLCSLGTELEGCCQTQSPLCMHQGQVLKQQKPEEQRTAEEASGNQCHQCPAEGSARATEQPCMLSILPRPPRGAQP